MKKTGWIAALFGLAFPLIGVAQALDELVPPEPPPLEELETVLVTGEQPGPGLWKVSKGGHVLWILGTYGPLPKDMIWQSKDVEARVAESQEVIFPGRTTLRVDMRVLASMTTLPGWSREAGASNPKLKDVLPDESWGKWQELQAKYIDPARRPEVFRPAFAATLLQQAALDKSGLGEPVDIGKVVSDTAKQHKRRIRTLPAVKLNAKVKSPGELSKNIYPVEPAEIECFDRTMDGLEADLEARKLRANAWARGNLQALSQVSGPENASKDCFNDLMNTIQNGEGEGEGSAAMRTGIDNIEQKGMRVLLKAEQDWLAAVKAALKRNTSSFAVLPVNTAVRYADQLRKHGYEVEAPL